MDDIDDIDDPVEAKMVQSIIWSNNVFPLAEFIDKYELPQLVCVESGWFGENERSTLSGGQLLMLHSLRHTTKVMCEQTGGNLVAIPFLCPLKAEIQPLPRDCPHATLTPDLLGKKYKDVVKYLRVISPGDEVPSKGQSCVDDILKVQSIDEKGIRCTNVVTKAKIFFPYGNTALFVPLIDDKKYTLVEIKKKFGFPAKVKFHESKLEKQLRHKNKDSSTPISSLHDVVVFCDFPVTDVVSTTICGSENDKVCYFIPKQLQVTIVVAEGFISGDQSYQKVVRTLHQDFQRTNLEEFEGLHLSQHNEAVSKGSRMTTEDVSTEQVPDHMIDLRLDFHAKVFLKDTTPQPPPPLPKRKPRSQSESSSMSLRYTEPPEGPLPHTRPRPLPKPPKPIPNPKPTHSQTLPNISKTISNSTNSSLNSPKVFRDKLSKALSLSDSVKSKLNLFHSNQTMNSECTYVEPVERPHDSLYTPMDDSSVDDVNYEDVMSPEDKGEIFSTPSRPDIPLPAPPTHTSTSPGYESDDHIYEKFGQSKRPNEKHGQRPNIPLPAPPIPVDPTKQKALSHDVIYEAISRIPLDLSGLSVDEVGKALEYLNMSDYVPLFAKELIDGEMLQSMDKESLESLNLKSHHITKLLKFIGGWRPRT